MKCRLVMSGLLNTVSPIWEHCYEYHHYLFFSLARAIIFVSLCRERNASDANQGALLDRSGHIFFLLTPFSRRTTSPFPHEKHTILVLIICMVLVSYGVLHRGFTWNISSLVSSRFGTFFDATIWWSRTVAICDESRVPSVALPHIASKVDGRSCEDVTPITFRQAPDRPDNHKLLIIGILPKYIFWTMMLS